MPPIRTAILGAAGRDFHNFNVHFRGNPAYEVVAFTATQIPNIEGRVYPAELAGNGYPRGIPIHLEEDLERLIERERIELVVFAYSDVSHEHVMHLASRAQAAGADFELLGPDHTMLEAAVPVIAVCAARTGSGKSQTTRRVSHVLREADRKVVVVRHPMPYGDIVAQRVQRFAELADLRRQNCTIEEMEEYEPHLALGNVVYAGVDYGAILERAQEEAEILLWDGGNNDLPFFRPDHLIVVVDPHRAGHERRYYPGETNVRMADTVVINKVDTAPRAGVDQVRRNVGELNPSARIVEAASPITVEEPEAISGKRVLVVEDGPTLTHGEMTFGAGVVAARRYGATVVDPRPYAVGSIAETFRRYPGTGPVLPAMGYGEAQIADLRATIDATPCDAVIVATPIDLRRVVDARHPMVRVRYELEEIGSPTLADVLAPFLARARRRAG
ncbi:MAG TPA: cyclic 2,3-diphosphoglycerate synthase [Gemmatimonadota bacterium]